MWLENSVYLFKAHDHSRGQHSLKLCGRGRLKNNENTDVHSVPEACEYVCPVSDSVSEIARKRGIREGAVSMTLNRLRGKLKKHLTERGFDL